MNGNTMSDTTHNPPGDVPVADTEHTRKTERRSTYTAEQNAAILRGAQIYRKASNPKWVDWTRFKQDPSWPMITNNGQHSDFAITQRMLVLTGKVGSRGPKPAKRKYVWREQPGQAAATARPAFTAPVRPQHTICFCPKCGNDLRPHQAAANL